MQSPVRAWSRTLRLLIYAVCLGAFIVDLTVDAPVVFGVFYIPLVTTAVYHRQQSAGWWLAALASIMVIIGLFLPSISRESGISLVNRILSIVAIVMTGYLIHHERKILKRLAEQTARAEAADRAKSELFNNLSHELRTPLAAILGFAELLSARAGPDQVAALGHIKSGGKRLLATLDNLFDLTQIDDRTLRVRSIDLGATLQQAVEDSRPLAVGKEISLILAPAVPPPPRVLADGWALRRIIDNLVGNAIKFTEAGGTVEVSLREAPEGLVVAVRDTGAGMPPEVLEQIGRQFYQADSGFSRRYEGMGTGLALSLRLADAMGAALHFDSAPGEGTTATLVLPVGG
ncbi:MAG TPA: HAMP domain-containing sensor histidine kinase [Acetobacteraceae bacterium]|nr:HAMP domain-containing sensor histidine kinase [Acetobacteraceae bacterium]